MSIKIFSNMKLWCMSTPFHFSLVFTLETIKVTSCLLPGMMRPLRNVFNLLRKEFVAEEQIRSFQNWPAFRTDAKMKIAELLLLRVYLFILNDSRENQVCT